MVLGNKSEAIKNYKKSLSLNPKNDNGIQMLSKLGVEVDKESLYLLTTEDTWTKEIFIFPLHFAPEIPYEGKEESHFPKGWRKLESPEFWSYVYTWEINLKEELTSSFLETNLSLYFDGLMQVVNNDKDLKLPATIAKFHKENSNNETSNYEGTLNIYDAFITKDSMTLNVKVEKEYCDQKKKSVITFKFSPKSFGSDIWQTLDKIKLRDNVCEQ